MKAGLLILPFLALLIGAFGAAIGSAYPELDWVTYAGWAVAASVTALWVILDIDTFKRVFARKGAKYGASSGVVLILGVLVIVGIARVTSLPRFNKSIDLTRDGVNTLSDQTIKTINLVNQGDDKIQFEAFFIDEMVEQKFRDLVHLYQAEGAKFSIRYIDPRTDPLAAKAQDVTQGNTVIVTHGDQEVRITTFNEEKLTNSLVNVLKSEKKKVYFTTGHGEGQLTGTEPFGFDKVKKDLERSKYVVEPLALLEEAKVPDDADALVIAGPKYELKAEELRFVEDYLMEGGSLLVMIDALSPVDEINGLLEKFGTRFEDDFLILSPDNMLAQVIGQNNAIVSDFDAFNPVTKDFSQQSAVRLVLQNTRSLIEVEDNANKMKVTLAGKTVSDMVRVKDVRTEADLENIDESRLEAGSFPVMAVIEGRAPGKAMANNQKAQEGEAKSDVESQQAAPSEHETRIVVVGSTQFATNQGAELPEHRDMITNIVSYLMQDEDFISIRPKDPTKTNINITSANSQLLMFLLVWIYPLTFLGGGVFTWLRRRQA